jgi:fumarate hydratase class II
MPQQKVCAMELALNKLTEQQLIEAVQEIARKNHDGHFTIMAFTTGYRVGFYGIGL